MRDLVDLILLRDFGRNEYECGVRVRPSVEEAEGQDPKPGCRDRARSEGVCSRKSLGSLRSPIGKLVERGGEQAELDIRTDTDKAHGLRVGVLGRKPDAQRDLPERVACSFVVLDPNRPKQGRVELARLHVVCCYVTILLPWVPWNAERSTAPFLCAHFRQLQDRRVL